MKQRKLNRQVYKKPRCKMIAVEEDTLLLDNSRELEGQHKPIESDGEILESKQNGFWSDDEE